MKSYRILGYNYLTNTSETFTLFSLSGAIGYSVDFLTSRFDELDIFEYSNGINRIKFHSNNETGYTQFF